MSPVHRAWPRSGIKVPMDVRLLESIEELANAYDMPERSVLAALWARREGTFAPYPNHVYDPDLESDTRKAFNGCWLELEEAYPLMMLRGWNRARRGTVMVDAKWLTAVRNMLDNFTLSFGSNCDDEIKDLRDEVDHGGTSVALLDAAVNRMAKQDMCGECEWCRSMDLREECDLILDAAGLSGGSRFDGYRHRATA